MPRTIREANLATRESRKRQKVSGKPYWRKLDEGLHLGYRKSQAGSAWVVRWYVGNGAYKIAKLEARPDDVLDADGATVLNWSQAQAKAREAFQRLQREAAGLGATPSGPYTVGRALDDYRASYERRGGRALGQMVAAIEAHIRPALGNVVLNKLTRSQIESWHDKLSKVAPRVRATKGADPKHRTMETSKESQRRRKSTANRVLTILKAALNQALQDRYIISDEAWRTVKPFKNVDAARIRYLSDDESRRLVSASDLDFRPLVQAALLTGGRYGELIALKAGDFSRDSGTIHIREAKSGRPRYITLSDEGRGFFDSMTNGQVSNGMTNGQVRDALIFTKADGTAWAKSHQQRPFGAALKRAKLGPMTFHELRHTYASRLVMKGVPMAVVAAQLGHSDTRMVEKHYGHMTPSYIAETVRAAFGPMGIVEPSNVTPMTRPKTR